MGEPRGKLPRDADDSAGGLGDRDEGAWVALLAELSPGERELLWTVGMALRHLQRDVRRSAAAQQTRS